jgi:hypothetical protein
MDVTAPLSTAMERLRAHGYTEDFHATDDGQLACPACDTAADPATMQVDHTGRFEGQTDPGDESILMAVTCQCGARGLYTAAYGPAASAADADLLARFAQRPRDN